MKRKKTLFMLLAMLMTISLLAQKEKKVDEDVLQKSDTLLTDTLKGKTTVVNEWFVTDYVVAANLYNKKTVILSDTTYTKGEGSFYTATSSQMPDVISMVLSDSAMIKIRKLIMDELRDKGKIY